MTHPADDNHSPGTDAAPKRRVGWPYVVGWITISKTLTVRVDIHANIVWWAHPRLGSIQGKPAQIIYALAAARGYQLRRMRYEPTKGDTQ